MAEPILLAKRDDLECFLLPEMANRHGLVTGATGTGKTVTLQTLAEAFSRRGVPVFLADVKGDLAGITQPGTVSPRLAAVFMSPLRNSTRERVKRCAWLSPVERHR